MHPLVRSITYRWRRHASALSSSATVSVRPGFGVCLSFLALSSPCSRVLERNHFNARLLFSTGSRAYHSLSHARGISHPYERYPTTPHGLSLPYSWRLVHLCHHAREQPSMGILARFWAIAAASPWYATITTSCTLDPLLRSRRRVRLCSKRAST